MKRLRLEGTCSVYIDSWGVPERSEMMRFSARKDMASVLGCLAAAALLITYAPAASAGAVRGLAACGSVILPAVFPFLTVSVFLAGVPGGEKIAAGLSGIVRRGFRLPAEAAPALLMSWIGGYPAGAKTLVELKKQGSLTKQEAQNGAVVMIHSGPAYMVGIVGGGIFGSVRAGLLLFLCQLAAGLLTARIFASGRAIPARRVLPDASRRREPTAVLLVRSVSSAAGAAVNICAFVVLLSAFAGALSACGLFPLLGRGLTILSGGAVGGEAADCLLTGLLEICAGSTKAAALPPAQAAKLLPFLLSFGGLSVCCQVAACFGEDALPWGRLLMGRLLHGALTAFLAAPWLGRTTVQAMTGAAAPAFSTGRTLWGSGAMLLLCLLLAARWERGLPEEGIVTGK